MMSIVITAIIMMIISDLFFFFIRFTISFFLKRRLTLVYLYLSGVRATLEIEIFTKKVTQMSHLN